MLSVCPPCGAAVPLVGSIRYLVREDDLFHVGWRCRCGASGCAEMLVDDFRVLWVRLRSLSAGLPLPPVLTFAELEFMDAVDELGRLNTVDDLVERWETFDGSDGMVGCDGEDEEC